MSERKAYIVATRETPPRWLQIMRINRPCLNIHPQDNLFLLTADEMEATLFPDRDIAQKMSVFAEIINTSVRAYTQEVWTREPDTQKTCEVRES